MREEGIKERKVVDRGSKERKRGYSKSILKERVMRENIWRN